VVVPYSPLMTYPVHKAGTTNMKAKIKFFAIAVIGIGFLSGCNTGEKEKVQTTQTEVNRIISEHGRTHEKGDGIIYVSEVEQLFKVKTGEESKHEL
jgi:hypothetical protein